MRSTIKKPGKKCFFTKSYTYLWQVEEAICSIQKMKLEELQLSVLGKLFAGNYLVAEQTFSKNELKGYWKDSLGVNTDLGLFYNPEIGSMFIAGPLVKQFLHTINGKPLGALSSGPYGILRGLGFDEIEAAHYLKNLSENHYLLFVRGYGEQLYKMEYSLINSTKVKGNT